MLLNHHILAKATTDAILDKFKTAEWECISGVGKDFLRVGTSASFPSPDASFYDPSHKIIASFEFKPPTETKRGILTGVGQSIAYLEDANISYLVAPKMLGDFCIGDYLVELYKNQIHGKIPSGLILYSNNNPSDVDLALNVDSVGGNGTVKKSESDRFWAKHQDLPIALFHLILHYYYLKRINLIDGDPFASCWNERLIPKNIKNDFTTGEVYDVCGEKIKTVAGTKDIKFLEKKVQKYKIQPNGLSYLLKDIDSTYIGDNYYNSIRKNYLTFMKHLQMIDSENNITDNGFKMYHLGLMNGPNSKVFCDYFSKEVLITGHHLDLILDFDSLKQKLGRADVNIILEKWKKNMRIRDI